jgi:hypothetical protein
LNGIGIANRSVELEKIASFVLDEAIFSFVEAHQAGLGANLA